MKITTNNKPRHLIYGYELPEKVRAEFDYYSNDDLNDATFFKYKGQYYDISQFTCCDIKGWQGCHNDTYFSGLFIKFTEDSESVIVAQYYS